MNTAIVSILIFDLLGHYIAGIVFGFYFMIAFWQADNPTIRTRPADITDIIFFCLLSTLWPIIISITVFIRFGFFFPHAKEWLQKQINKIVGVIG